MAVDSKYVDLADNATIFRNTIRAVAVIAAAFFLKDIVAFASIKLIGVESIEVIRSDPALFGGLTTLGFIGFGLAGVGYLVLRNEWDLLYLPRPTRRDLAWILGGIVLISMVYLAASIVLTLVVNLLETLFGMTVEAGQHGVIASGRENPTLLLLLIPVTLLVVGPAEELIFRGIVQGLFRESLGVVPGVVIASSLFGLGHYFATTSGNPWTFIFLAGTLGVVLGALYEYTETLLVPAVVHGLWNTLQFAGLYYVTTNPSVLPG